MDRAGDRRPVPLNSARSAADGQYPGWVPDDSHEAAVPPPGDRPTREHLTAEDVAKVADLAMLDLADDELDRFTGQLDAVLDLAADEIASATASMSASMFA